MGAEKPNAVNFLYLFYIIIFTFTLSFALCAQAQVDQALSEVDDYKTNTHDIYVFPDEIGYQRHILDEIKIPIKNEVQIEDSTGHAYSLENAAR